MTQVGYGGLLTTWMDIPPEYEEEFNHWYNTEHIRERIDIPGFLNGRRYRSLEGGPKYFALYGLEEPDVVYRATYTQVRNNPTPWMCKIVGLFENFVRNVYEGMSSYGESSRQGAPYVLTVRVGISPDREEEFNTWYDEDHVPALLNVEGVRGARRYRAVEGVPKYLAVYELDNPELLQSEAWSKARDYGRSLSILPHLRDLQRNVGELIFQLNK